MKRRRLNDLERVVWATAYGAAFAESFTTASHRIAQWVHVNAMDHADLAIACADLAVEQLRAKRVKRARIGVST